MSNIQFVCQANKQEISLSFLFTKCFIKHCITAYAEPKAPSTRIGFHRDVVFNEDATIVLYLHIVFVSFSAVYAKTMKTVKASGNPLFAC